MRKRRRIEPPDTAVVIPPGAAAIIPSETLDAGAIPPGADVDPAVAHAPRGPNVSVPDNSHTYLRCRSCNTVIGRYKSHPNPGNRDAASWFLQVYHEGQFATRGHLKTVRVCHLFDEESCMAWIRVMRTACACANV